MWPRTSQPLPGGDSLWLKPVADEEQGRNAYLTLEEEQVANNKLQSRRRYLPLLVVLPILLVAAFIGFNLGLGQLETANTSDDPVTASQARDGEAPTVEEDLFFPNRDDDEDDIVEIMQLPDPLVDSCHDGRQNQGELGVDCGGPCPHTCNEIVLIPPTFAELDPNLAPNYAGCYEGGPTGKIEDQALNNALTQAQVEAFLPGLYDVPTGALPSPRFGVNTYTAKFLRCEEMGNKPLPRTEPVTIAPVFHVLPQPSGIADYPQVDNWIRQSVENISPQPYPREYSNTKFSNPWHDLISSYLGRPVEGVLEGRPPSINWRHQRWNEFFPREYAETVTTGARPNRGERNRLQRHMYTMGEFGPGGLYNQVAPGFGPTQGTAGLEVRFHPAFPVQDRSSVWTFDGTLPPKMLLLRYGKPFLLRHHNGLPIDVTANNGFGLHCMTTHEHNGHTPAESDGHANAFFFPGSFYDYRYPMAVAGYDSINTDASDPRMSCPEEDGTSTNLRGDYREIMSTHWAHDHMIDHTAPNVYKGMMMAVNYYSGIDRGAEHINDGVNLKFPSGQSLSWGNRDYDIDFVLSDKAFDQRGQLWFNPYDVGGFLGDLMTVNLLYKPLLEVRRRKYRFRILDASISRIFKICIATKDPITGQYIGFPIYLIANDGNIMEHSIYFPDGCLPEQGIAERFDIIVDFTNLAPGAELWFVNLAEHQNGRKVNSFIPLEQVHLYNKTIGPVVVSPPGVLPEIIADRYLGDPVVGEFCRVVVVENLPGQVDLSMNPEEYLERVPVPTVPGLTMPGKKMIEVPRITQQDLQNAIYHDLVYKRQGGNGNQFPNKPWVIGIDGQGVETADMNRISITSTKNSDRVQVWVYHSGGGWSHPIHSHFEEVQIINADGAQPPDYEFFARKDVVKIGAGVASYRDVYVAFKTREFSGTFTAHCHNTQHEDWAMLFRWDVENPGQIQVIPNVFPTWDKVDFPVVENQVLGLFREGVPLEDVGDELSNVTTGTDSDDSNPNAPGTEPDNSSNSSDSPTNDSKDGKDTGKSAT